MTSSQTVSYDKSLHILDYGESDVNVSPQVLHYGSISTHNTTDTFVECAVHGDTWSLQELVNGHDVDVNELSSKGFSALYAACLHCRLPAVKYLLEVGADIDQPNKGGLTALHAACSSGALNIVEYLIISGANVEILNNAGQSPIFSACEKGQLGTVKFLIERIGVNTQITDNMGKTILFPAVQCNHLALVQYLVVPGTINMHHISLDGHQAAFGACKNGYLQIINFLQDAKSPGGCQPSYQNFETIQKTLEQNVTASESNTLRFPSLIDKNMSANYKKHSPVDYQNRKDMITAMKLPIEAEKAYGAVAFQASKSISDYKEMRNEALSPSAAKIQARFRGGKSRNDITRMLKLEAENLALRKHTQALSLQLAKKLPEDLAALQKIYYDSEKRIADAITKQVMAETELKKYKQYVRFSMSHAALTATRQLKNKQKAKRKLKKQSVRTALETLDKDDELVSFEIENKKRAKEEREARAVQAAEMSLSLAEMSLEDANTFIK